MALVLWKAATVLLPITIANADAQQLPALTHVDVGVWYVSPGGGYIVVGVEGHRWLLDYLRLQRSQAAALCEGASRSACAQRLTSYERQIGRINDRIQALLENNVHAERFSAPHVLLAADGTPVVQLVDTVSGCTYSAGASAWFEDGCGASAWCTVSCPTPMEVYSHSIAYADPVWNGQYWDACWDEWEDWDPSGTRARSEASCWGEGQSSVPWADVECWGGADSSSPVTFHADCPSSS